MENLIFLLSAFFAYRLNLPTKWEYVEIGDTGNAVLLPTPFEGFHEICLESNDTIYSTELESEGGIWGLHYMDLGKQVSLSEAEVMLEYYIIQIKRPYHLVAEAGLEMAENEDALRTTTTCIDYWQDNTGSDWKLKGYATKDFICILYVKNISELAVTEVDSYLNGLYFS